LIAALLTLAVAALVGAPFARLADRDAPLLQFLGESLLFGTGIVATLLMLLGLAGIPWSIPIVAFSVLSLAAIGFSLARRLGVWSFPHGDRDRRPYLIDALTLVTLAGYARFATAAPMWELDFIDNWGLKGRVFWQARGFVWEFLTNPFYRWSHQDYPPLVPLVFNMFSLVAGQWEDRWIGLYYVAVAAALLMVIRSLLTEEIGAFRAAAATLALTCVIASPWPGLADGPLVAYATTALLLIRRALQTKCDARITGAAVLLGFAALTKNEGMSLVLSTALALAIAGGWRRALRLWPAAVMAAPWILARARFQLGTDLATGSVFERALDHLREPQVYLHYLVRYSPGQPVLWLGIALGILAGIRSVPRERLLLVTAVMQIVFYLAAYLVTPLDVEFHIRWSWDRLVWHVIPMLAFVSLVSVSRFAWPDRVAAPSLLPSTIVGE